MGGAIGSGMLKPQSLEQMQDVEGQPGSSGFWTLRYYQPLFDIDTIQVLNRIKGSLLPRPRGVFFDLISANPDLWGPFWIATTLIFAMAVTGNLSSYYAYTGPAGGWTYNFNQLTLAGSVIYSYVTLLPLLLWAALRYYEAQKRLVDIICIYGYTLGVFVPVSILCVLPSEPLRWLLVLAGGGVSALFLLSNFHAHLSDCFPYGEGAPSLRCTCTCLCACTCQTHAHVRHNMHTCTCTCPQTHVRHMSGTDTCQAHAHAHVHVHAMHMSGRQAGRQAGRQTVATLTRPRAPFGRLSSPRAPLVLTGGWRGWHATSSTRRDATSSAPFRDFSETVPRPVRDRAETFPVRRIVQATQSGRWRRCSAGWRPAIWCCCCYSSSTSSTTPDATPDTTPEEAACGGGRAAAGVRRQHARLHARMCACAGGEEARRHDRRASRGHWRVGLVETRERRPSVVPPPVECRAVVGRAAADVVRLGRLQTRICSSPVFPVSTLQTRHLRTMSKPH